MSGGWWRVCVQTTGNHREIGIAGSILKAKDGGGELRGKIKHLFFYIEGRKWKSIRENIESISTFLLNLGAYFQRNGSMQIKVSIKNVWNK